MRIALLLALALALTACAQSSAIPLNANTVQITTSAAPVCGPTGAQKVAFRRAAIETIKRGFDKFQIVGGQYRNDVRVVGHTPVVANTAHTGSIYSNGYGSATYGGSSHTTYSGGQPIIGGKHSQAMVIKMFKADEPAGANALSARQQLGPKWQEAIKENAATTCN